MRDPLWNSWGASVIGPLHVKAGIPNQDSWRRAGINGEMSSLYRTDWAARHIQITGQKPPV
jgi:hypothetical protein